MCLRCHPSDRNKFLLLALWLIRIQPMFFQFQSKEWGVLVRVGGYLATIARGQGPSASNGYSGHARVITDSGR